MKINTINKLPFIVVAGLNFSAMLLTCGTIIARKYFGIINSTHWKLLSNISENILILAIILLPLSIIYYCYIRKWKYLIWLLVISFNPVTLIWLIVNV